MKVLLAIVSLILAALCLVFCAAIGYMIYETVDWNDIGEYSAELIVGFAFLVVSFLVGLAFTIAGGVMLSSKPGRQQ